MTHVRQAFDAYITKAEGAPVGDLQGAWRAFLTGYAFGLIEMADGRAAALAAITNAPDLTRIERPLGQPKA